MKTLPEYRTDDEIEIIVRGMQGRDPWTRAGQFRTRTEYLTISPGLDGR